MKETRHEQQHGDRGASFVEVLVAIVLLGTVVVAALAGLRASIIGTEVDEDSARSQAWLQAATDEIYGTPYLGCDTNSAANIVLAYQSAADAATRPNGWASGATIVVTDVRYLSGTGTSEAWGAHSTCAAGNAGSPIYPQLIFLRVTDPEGIFTARLEVIKSV